MYTDNLTNMLQDSNPGAGCQMTDATQNIGPVRKEYK